MLQRLKLLIQRLLGVDRKAIEFAKFLYQYKFYMDSTRCRNDWCSDKLNIAHWDIKEVYQFYLTKTNYDS